MKITVENALSEYPKVRKGMPEKLENVFNNEKFPKMFKYYGKSEKITHMLDHWLRLVNEELEKRGEAEEKPKEKSESNHKKEKAPKEQKLKKGPKQKKEKEKIDIEFVKDLPIELRYIHRYTLLDGKDASKPSVKEQAKKLLKSLQTTIVKGIINKKSEWADIISQIQKNLIKIVDEDETVIKLIDKEILIRLCKSMKVDTDITLQKAFIRLIGSDDKNSIKRLINRFDDKYSDKKKSALMQDLYESLNKAYKNNKAVVPTAYSLSGLKGLF